MTQQINLLDPALLPQRDWCTGRFILGMAAVLAVIVAGQWFYEQQAMARLLARSQAADTGEHLSALDEEIAEMQTQLAHSEALLRTAGGLTELPKDNAARAQALFDAMPQNLWLDEVEFGANQRVRIRGGVSDAAGLATFSQRLGTAAAYSRLPLRVVALAPQEQGPVERRDTPASLTAPALSGPFHFMLASTDNDPSSTGDSN